MQALLSKSRIKVTRDVIVPPAIATVNSRSFPLCGDILRRLKEANPELGLSYDLQEWVHKTRLLQKGLEEIKGWHDAPGDKRAYPYQRVGVYWLQSIKRGILADDQGLGKTVMASLACRSFGGKKIAVLCKSASISTWSRHLRDYFSPGPTMEQRGRGVTYIAHENGASTIVSNYDNMAEVLDFEPTVLIADEAHALRNRKTIAFKKLKTIAKKLTHVYLLTASPTVNSDTDLWPLLHLCDPDRFSSYWSYIFRFFEISDTGYGIKVGRVKDEEKEAHERMISQYLIHRDESIKPLPGIVRVRKDYHLPNMHRDLYQQMEVDWVARYGDRVVEAPVKVSQLTRLRQMAISPRLVFPEYTGPDKIDPLMNILLETEYTTIVFSQFSGAAHLAQERAEWMDIPSAVIDSGVSLRERDLICQGLGSKYRVVFLTHQTGGESLTLIEATQAIFLDLAWHPAGNRHAMKRIHRIGQQKGVVVHYIKAIDTVEDFVEDTVRGKALDMTTGDLIRKMKERSKRYGST